MAPVLPELRLLRVFTAVVEERSFTRAGESLHLTQQSISEAMRKLESQLGYELVRRSPRGIELTVAGEVLARELPEAIAGLKRALLRTDLAANRLIGTLAIGCSFDLETELRTAIAGALERHPGLKASFSVAAQRDLIQDLRQRRLDLALTWQLADDAADIITVPLRSEPLAVAFRAGHPLEDDRPILSVAELAPFPIIMHERNLAPGPYDMMIRQFTDHGVNPTILHIPIYTSGHQARLESVRSGDAVALGAAGILTQLATGQKVRIRTLTPSTTIGIVWAKADSALADAVIPS